MLVLSRKIQQQILIPESGIRITVIGIGSNRVHLGIEAPSNIHVTRPEVEFRSQGTRLSNEPAGREVVQGVLVRSDDSFAEQPD